MPRELIISEEAIGDLDDVWDYISGDSPLKANRFIDQLYRKCLDIAELEGVGRSRDELSGGLLSIPHKKYVIFFERDEKQVRIVRILRGSRDIEEVFVDN